MITPSRRSDPAVIATFLSQLSNTPASLLGRTGKQSLLRHTGAGRGCHRDGGLDPHGVEVAVAGLPVLVVRLEGGSAKFTRFHNEMRRAGFTRAYEGHLTLWKPPPFDEMPALAAQVAALLPLFIPAGTAGLSSAAERKSHD